VKKSINDQKAFFFAFLGAIAWIAHFLIIYIIKEFGCIAGIDWIGPAVVIFTVIFLGIGTYSIWKSFNVYRNASKDEASVAGYIGLFGLLNNLVFTFIIVFQSIPIFYLRECL
jgi:hypothetical protein